MTNLGWHYLAEFHGCDPAALGNLEKLRNALLESLKLAGAAATQDVFHASSPQGVTGVVAVDESHATIHTWPEHGYAALDVFSGKEQLHSWSVIDAIGRAVHAREVETREIPRGRDRRASFAEFRA